MLSNLERIRALMGNIKNWSWDIYPKFTIHREDAEALKDLEALKEYVREQENRNA